MRRPPITRLLHIISDRDVGRMFSEEDVGRRIFRTENEVWFESEDQRSERVKEFNWWTKQHGRRKHPGFASIRAAAAARRKTVVQAVLQGSRG